jgi:hypothetical protein
MWRRKGGDEAMAETNTCRIKIIRASQYADMLRSYQIMLNGQKAGSIAKNDVLELTAPAGRVTIEARIDWGRSEPLTIDAKPGETNEIEVRNHWGNMLALWAITFGRSSYIELRLLPKAG